MKIGDTVKPKYNYHKQLRGVVKDIVCGPFEELLAEVEWHNGRFPRFSEIKELEVVDELQMDNGSD